tara:strand:+ start:2126 stop:7333 length:5208 start_codon:yes stop_codon:yes gene_type:complete
MLDVCYLKNGAINKTYKLNIHRDDSIDIIKKKILIDVDEATSFDEMYLFGIRKSTINPHSAYKNLTQNDKYELSQDRLYSYLQNIVDFNVVSIDKKDEYNFSDFLYLKLDSKERHIKTPIGQKFIIKRQYPFTVNPFDAVATDELLATSGDDILSTQNGNLLFECGDIETIFVCMAEDVLKEKSSVIPEELLIKIYFPYLYKKNIETMEKIKKNKRKLAKDVKKLADSKFQKYNKSIDVFHKLHDNSLKYMTDGIESVFFTVHQMESTKYSLEIFFKLIKTNKKIPFVKLNPGQKSEKMYRIYADSISTNGKKIPFLQKNKIIRLKNNISTHKSVGVCIFHEGYEIICEINERGAIKIICDFQKPLKIPELNSIIGKAVNPLLSIIKEYLSQSGYSFVLFDKISDPNVETNKLTYTTTISMKEKINVKKYRNCISNILNVKEGKESFDLQFKRVSNFNEMTSKGAMIIELINEGKQGEEIISGLVSNFGMKKDEARLKLAESFEGLNFQRGLFENKKFVVKNNPGFNGFLKKNNFTQTTKLSFFNINHIKYVDILPIYIEAFFKLIAGKKVEEATGVCKMGDINIVEDIISKPEASFLENETADIEEDGQITFDDEEGGDDLLDMIMGDSSDEESSDESEDEEPPKKAEPPKKEEPPKNDEPPKEEDINPAGIRLSNPNYFFKRLYDRDPKLFLKKREGKFLAYSRVCQSNQRRQPVILTDEEKDFIDKHYPGSYRDNKGIDSAIRFGSGDEKYWYICPRYWCFADPDNGGKATSLTEEDVKNGKCGGEIIPRKDKVIPEGKRIYEFLWETGHMKHGKYQWHTPGFLKIGKNSDGSNRCIPCCFGNDWNVSVRNRRRKACGCDKEGTYYRKKPGEKARVESSAPVSTKKTTRDDYIKGTEKHPIEVDRFGHLPVILSKMLFTKSLKCMGPTLKEGKVCFLRKGVEYSKIQSFLAAIADACDLTVPDSIGKLKKRMIERLTLDQFITYQHGTLFSVFEKEPGDITKYADTTFVKKTKNKEYAKRVVGAFDNFKNYINDKNVKIDYKYLWDFVCKDLVLESGINLVILNIPEDDVTDNVEVICPSNQYSNVFYHSEKPTLILTSKNGFYEPIYKVWKTEKDTFAPPKKFFTEQSDDIMPNIKKMLGIIKANMAKCKPQKSMDEYSFKRGIPLTDLIEELTALKYKIKKQIVNYSTKVIGVMVEKGKYKGFVPCAPSPIIIGMTYQYFDEGRHWNDYTQTRALLEKLHSESKGKIPSKPVMNVFGSGSGREIVVGVLTETNQMVRLSNPQLKNARTADLGEIRDVLDDMLDEGADTDRTDNIRRIKLESNFFNAFRNTTRILLNHYNNKKKREEIAKIIDNPLFFYREKLKKIERILREMLAKHVAFVLYGKKIIEDVSICLHYKGKKCTDKSCCALTKGKCVLQLPKKNLMSEHDNEKIYFGRMADELIRYSQIRQFMFKPQIFMPFHNLQYNLGEDEIILTDTISDYFKDLVLMAKNPYINHSTNYYTAEPNVSLYYSNKGVSKIEEKKDINPCIKKSMGKFKRQWKKVFSTAYKLVDFQNNAECSWQIIKTVIDHYTAKNNDLATIKRRLIAGYKDHDGALERMKEQGKGELATKIQRERITFEAALLSQDYFLTSMDFYVLAMEYKLPLVLFSGLPLAERSREKSREERKALENKMVTYGDKDAYYFIRIKQEGAGIPTYSLLYRGSFLIPFSTLSDQIKELVKKTRFTGDGES